MPPINSGHQPIEHNPSSFPALHLSVRQSKQSTDDGRCPVKPQPLPCPHLLFGECPFKPPWKLHLSPLRSHPPSLRCLFCFLGRFLMQVFILLTSSSPILRSALSSYAGSRAVDQTGEPHNGQIQSGGAADDNLRGVGGFGASLAFFSVNTAFVPTISTQTIQAEGAVLLEAELGDMDTKMRERRKRLQLQRQQREMKAQSGTRPSPKKSPKQSQQPKSGDTRQREDGRQSQLPVRTRPGERSDKAPKHS